MPRAMALVLLALAALAAAPAHAADPDAVAGARRMLQAGVDSARARQVLAARARFKALSEAEPSLPLLHYWVALSDWRLVPLLGRGADRSRAERYCREGVRECDETLRLEPRSAEALALKGSLQGLLLGFEPSAMMTLGPEASLNLSRAKELEPENPRVWLLDGMGTLHKPAEFGGGPAPALEKLRRAQALFAGRASAVGLTPDWGAADAFIWAGLAAQQAGDLATARAMFQKALEAAPGNVWVRDVLLPRASKAPANAGRP